jgi:hypothetical protein
MGQLLERLRNAEPTYREVGETLTGGRPEVFRHDCYEAELGRGPQTYLRAVQGLKTWRAHRLPGSGGGGVPQFAGTRTLCSGEAHSEEELGVEEARRRRTRTISRLRMSLC